MAAAEASLRTSIERMSEGLMVARGDWLRPVAIDAAPFPTVDEMLEVLEVIGTPSITKRGSLLPLGEIEPRILTSTEAPGWAEFEVMLRPATRPRSMLSTLAVALLSRSSVLTEETALVRFLTVVVP